MDKEIAQEMLLKIVKSLDEDSAEVTRVTSMTLTVTPGQTIEIAGADIKTSASTVDVNIQFSYTL